MAQLIIPEPFASRIRELAEQENRDIETVLERMISRYELQQTLESLAPPDIPELPPRPASSLTDDDIEVPDDIEDKEAYRTAARAIAPKLYDKARAYWRKMGNQERLALTDEELDKQFWLFDSEDIPRLKSEKGTIVLPADPLEALVGLIDSDQTDLSMTVRETIAQHFEKKHGRFD